MAAREQVWFFADITGCGAPPRSLEDRTDQGAAAKRGGNRADIEQAVPVQVHEKVKPAIALLGMFHGSILYRYRAILPSNSGMISPDLGQKVGIPPGAVRGRRGRSSRPEP